MRYSRIALAAAIVTAAACSKETAPKKAQAADETKADSAGGLVVPPSEPYRPGNAGSAASVVVSLVGDSGSTPSVASCKSADDDGASTASTIFWLDGIREGKPLPQDRRYELESNDCGLSPRVQATVIGGAIDVFNDLDAVHRLVFIRAGTNDTLQTMFFSNVKSMVATDRLTKTAGVVEVRCAQHPNEHAWIAVFDQPYFGVASSGDKVTLDAVPPGDYKVMTWHEGLSAPVAIPAKVGAAGSTEVVLK
jgi:hypothetical protein